jgi:hypothetical protein
VLVNDHAPNVETIGDAGLTFSGRDGVASLTAELERLFDQPALVEEFRRRARDRARRYSWDAVTDQYEALLTRVWQASRPGALPTELCDRPSSAPAPTGSPAAASGAGPVRFPARAGSR